VAVENPAELNETELAVPVVTTPSITTEPERKYTATFDAATAALVAISGIMDVINSCGAVKSFVNFVKSRLPTVMETLKLSFVEGGSVPLTEEALFQSVHVFAVYQVLS